MTDNEKTSATEITDNEIIKALECCSKNPPKCRECGYKGRCNRIDCYDYLKRDVLDLIKRQKAEIDRLNRDYSTAVETMSNSIRTIGAEKEALIAGQETLQKYIAEKDAEIERLKSPCEMQIEVSKEIENKIKSEAVKELAKKIKLEFYYEFEKLIPSIMADKIDNLVKEMVGEG